MNRGVGADSAEKLEAVLFPETTPQRFEAWVRRHTRMVYERHFPTERGRCYHLFGPRPPQRMTHGRTHTLLVMDAVFKRGRGGRVARRYLPHWTLSSAITLLETELHRGKRGYAAPEALVFEIEDLAPARIKVIARCNEQAVAGYFKELQREIAKNWPSAQLLVPDKADAPKREDGPTAKTQIRAEHFKKLKDEHPEWSQARVAIESSRPLEEGGLGEPVTGDTVRNAYRAMGWKWERADRIRP